MSKGAINNKTSLGRSSISLPVLFPSRHPHLWHWSPLLGHCLLSERPLGTPSLHLAPPVPWSSQGPTLRMHIQLICLQTRAARHVGSVKTQNALCHQNVAPSVNRVAAMPLAGPASKTHTRCLLTRLTWLDLQKPWTEPSPCASLGPSLSFADPRFRGSFLQLLCTHWVLGLGLRPHLPPAHAPHPHPCYRQAQHLHTHLHPLSC